MSERTDTQNVTYHDDGSYTVESHVTHYPPTRAQKAAGWGALGVVVVAPALPLLYVVVLEKFEEKNAARKARKALKKQNEKK